MSQKMDLYEALRVKKDATVEEIQRAIKVVKMTCHPDRAQGDKTKAARYNCAGDAETILLDENLRRAYDSGGYEAVERAKTRSTTGGGFDPGYTSTAPTHVPRQDISFKGLQDFVRRMNVDDGSPVKPASTSPVPSTAGTPAKLQDPDDFQERMRRRRAEARGEKLSPPAAKPPVAAPASPPEIFNAIAAVKAAQGVLGRDIPLDRLTEFRDNLAGALAAVDRKIAAVNAQPKP